jgi:hypothetical protein
MNMAAFDIDWSNIQVSGAIPPDRSGSRKSQANDVVVAPGTAAAGDVPVVVDCAAGSTRVDAGSRGSFSLLVYSTFV